jgi:hypothetical protein
MAVYYDNYYYYIIIIIIIAPQLQLHFLIKMLFVILTRQFEDV